MQPEGERFSAQLTVNLYESPQKYSVTFEHGGLRQTQALDDVDIFAKTAYPRLDLRPRSHTFIEFRGKRVSQPSTVEMAYEAKEIDTSSAEWQARLRHLTA